MMGSLFVVVFVCGLVASTQARNCFYSNSGALCVHRCCGKDDALQCRWSCNYIDCSTDEHCDGGTCCSDGKCQDSSFACPPVPTTKYISCLGKCSSVCCDHNNGTCLTGKGSGCQPLNSKCSLDNYCYSDCCHENQCQSSDVCFFNRKKSKNIGDDGGDKDNNGDNEQPIEEEHHSSTTSTNHLSSKTIIIVIAVVVAVVLKIVIIFTWVHRRRSRTGVVVVRRVLAPNTVQLNHTCDSSVPFLAHDEEQFKYEQPPPPYTTTA